MRTLSRKEFSDLKANVAASIGDYLSAYGVSMQSINNWPGTVPIANNIVELFRKNAFIEVHEPRSGGQVLHDTFINKIDEQQGGLRYHQKWLDLPQTTRNCWELTAQELGVRRED